MARTKWLNRSDYARHANVSPAAVTRWVAKGMPVHADRINPAEADAWRAANLDETHRRAKKDQGANVTLKTAAAAPTADIDLPDGSPLAEIPEFAASQRRKEFHAANLKELEVQTRRKELLPRADVEAATDTAITTFRAEFEGFAGSLSARLVGLPAVEMKVIIQDEVRRVLADITAALRDAAAGAVVPSLPEPDTDDDEDDDSDDGIL